jgi:hypothetical protein
MGKVQYNNEIIEFDDKFSGKVFTAPQVDLPDNTTVYASCFYQENLPDSHVFRDDLKGCKFYNCNLDNVFIPDGNEVIGGFSRRIMVQNDLNDWELDENNEPVKPLDSEILFEKFGLPVPKPQDIPMEKSVQRIDLKKAAEDLKANLDI